MYKILITSCVAGLIFLVSSCGPSKKLKAANAESEQLKAQVATQTEENNKLKNDVADLNKQVSDQQSQHQSLTNDYNNYKQKCQANEEKLKELSAVLDEYNENVKKLTEQIEAAEEKFNDKGIEVYSKNGVVYVDMLDNLLYSSGSTALSSKGKEALVNLSSVLNEFPDLKVIVIGNTDSVQKKGAKDNWSLSTERANGVVRVLRDNNVSPARLTAAGKSKFDPVADNSTAEGRAKNRRTEVVLNPDWDKLWESVQKH